MMKTLAGATEAFIRLAKDIHADPSALRKKYMRNAATFYFTAETYPLIAEDEQIYYFGDRLLSAAIDYSGSRSLAAIARRSEADKAVLWTLLLDALRDYMQALENARPASEARLMGRGIDPTQVDAPRIYEG